MRGCLALAAILAASFLIERQLTVGADLPSPTIVAAILALSVTLTLGSAQGIRQAASQASAPQDAPHTWSDGALVRVEGIVEPAGAPAVAPFSDRAAVFVAYEGSAPELHDTGSTRSRPRFQGVVAAASVLRVGGEPLPLSGMPNSRGWGQAEFRGEPYASRAARHIAATDWSRTTDDLSLDPESVFDTFAGSARDGSVARHVMNKHAADALGIEMGATNESSIAIRLQERTWAFRERLIEPGTLVTAVATFRTSPRRLDIALAPGQAAHALHQGGAAPLAGRQLRTALTFAAVLAVITVVLHVVALADGGTTLRRIVEAFAASQ